ncbi:AraC family transcriptional regulator [Parapedobacter defluvii]|uniref:AraC family transcriptional regulator n=1 Tax=Parapedobacter defluvii TaxID=2045106 RepID=A0ABQ1L1C3_9SPHI|nr:helix-turn-helix transcriptional regulator [Parapedobacter defluvii]GGC12960.1 AraC family transcriptional regulator [Parapedobacter defluvii]
MKQQGYPIYDIAGLTTFRPDIVVRPFAAYRKEHRKLHVPHRHRFYHMVYFTKGSGYHSIDFDRFPVQPHQLYAMAPSQVHHWNFEGDVDGYVLNFSASFFQSFLLRPDYIDDFPFFQGIAQQSVLDIPRSMQPAITELFEEMIPLAASLRELQLDKLRVLILKLFLDLTGINMEAAARSPHLSYSATLLRSFQKLVDKHFSELRLPRYYAAMLHITPNYLNTICSDLLGQSAGAVIRNRITLEAKRLLVNPTLSIATVAYMLNFEDNSYFTKFFKKNAGITPEAFRKSLMITGNPTE